jgi:hypothetical protein
MRENWPFTPFEIVFLVAAVTLTAGGVVMVGVR